MYKEGTCWLCGQFRPLTREHIPPRAAFNDSQVFLQSVSERSALVGRIEWEGKVEKGVTVRSLCAECNSKCGSMYGADFVQFLRKIASQVEAVPEGQQMLVSGVSRPLSIVKAVAQSFVSANGPSFVDKNPWLRKFLRNSRNQDWHPDARLYLFATNSRLSRRTGVAAFYTSSSRIVSVLAEFTFWPLGSVLSFKELRDPRLSPIHQWAKFDYKHGGLVDLSLTVNPVSTAYAVDFRSADELARDMNQPPNPLTMDSDIADEMTREVGRRSGAAGKLTFVSKDRPRIVP